MKCLSCRLETWRKKNSRYRLLINQLRYIVFCFSIVKEKQTKKKREKNNKWTHTLSTWVDVFLRRTNCGSVHVWLYLHRTFYRDIVFPNNNCILHVSSPSAVIETIPWKYFTFKRHCDFFVIYILFVLFFFFLFFFIFVLPTRLYSTVKFTAQNRHKNSECWEIVGDICVFSKKKKKNQQNICWEITAFFVL